MILTKKQINNLKAVDLGGKGGKDAIIAEALGHTRQSSRFYDALTEKGEMIEYKKQQTYQYIDPYKWSQMSKEDMKIKILFFVHDGSQVVEIYQTTYADLTKSMGYSQADLKAIAKLYKRKCFVERKDTQMKAKLLLNEIRLFKKIL
jgi:hypothetical protein